MNFIPRIRERRMEKHMNQKQFAELRVDQNTLSKWETGKARPSLNTFTRWKPFSAAP